MTPEDRIRVPSEGQVVPLLDEVKKGLTFQCYASAPGVAGVSMKSLEKHNAGNGWFLELLRLQGGLVEGAEGERGEFEARQLSLARAEPHRINAFHIHPLVAQQELWMVVEGTLTVWLIDCRPASPTARVRQRLVMSGEAPSRLTIPAGVAHGYRAGAAGGLLAYATDQQFDRERPNEGRLPWDFFGAEMWDEDRG